LYIAYDITAIVASIPVGHTSDGLGARGPVLVMAAGIALFGVAYAALAFDTASYPLLAIVAGPLRGVEGRRDPGVASSARGPLNRARGVPDEWLGGPHRPAQVRLTGLAKPTDIASRTQDRPVFTDLLPPCLRHRPRRSRSRCCLRSLVSAAGWYSCRCSPPCSGSVPLCRC
jgi:hypothetical protein